MNTIAELPPVGAGVENAVLPSEDSAALLVSSKQALRWVAENDNRFSQQTLSIKDRIHLMQYVDALAHWRRVPDIISAEYFVLSAEQLLMALPESIAERTRKPRFADVCASKEQAEKSFYTGPQIVGKDAKEIFMAALNFSLRLVQKEMDANGFAHLPPRIGKLFCKIPRLTQRSPSGHFYREKDITLKGQRHYLATRQRGSL